MTQSRFIIPVFAAALLAGTFPAWAYRFTVVDITQNAAPDDAIQHVVSTVPGVNETMTQKPNQVTITFARQVRADHLQVQVFDPFNQVISGPPQVQGLTVIAPLPETLQPGRYRVRYRAESVENLPMSPPEITDSYSFTIK